MSLKNEIGTVKKPSPILSTNTRYINIDKIPPDIIKYLFIKEQWTPDHPSP